MFQDESLTYINNMLQKHVAPFTGELEVLKIKNDILEFVPERRSNSRLTCQVPISERLDGMIVHIPASNLA